MADICLLCASEDVSKLKPLVNLLRSEVGTLWWMDDITDGNWTTHANREVRDSKLIVPIWTEYSVVEGCEVLNELEYARQISKTILPISLDSVVPPIPWTGHHKIDLGLKGKRNSVDWTRAVEGIRKSIGVQMNSQKADIEKSNLKHDFHRPLFAFSVSSFETAIGPDEALRILSLYPTLECCLVSAYDLIDHTKKGKGKKELLQKRLNTIDKLHRSGIKILLDSGNYEAFRKGERLDHDFAEKFEQERWTLSEFRAVLKKCTFDITFGFDTPGGIKGKRDAIERSIKSYELCRLPPSKVSPIVHLPRYKDGRFNTTLAPEIVAAVASADKFKMIAIPERELGDGIVERAKVVRKIKEALSTNKQGPALHLLGTGNPISLAIYAAAGADSFDGLEWCRTACDRVTGTLFHLQQYDFFASQVELSDSAVVKSACENPNVGYLVKVALHNIDAFSEWIAGVRRALTDKNLWLFIGARVGPLLTKEMRAALEDVVP